MANETWLENASNRGYSPGLTQVVDSDDPRERREILVAQPNSGLQRRFAPGGIAVNMFWGQPGVYYDDRGHPLPEALAEQAGYDVEVLAAEKKRRADIATASAKIDAEYNSPMVTKKVIMQRGGYKIIDIGKGLFNVEDSEGNRMNEAAPITKDIAIAVLDALAPEKKRAKGDDTV